MSLSPLLLNGVPTQGVHTEKTMKHFTDEAWFDYARCLLPAEEMKKMREHLDSGCRECAEIHATWAVVHEITSRQSDYEPREIIVDSAKTAYPQGSKVASVFEAIKAALIFDSFRAGAALAGVRSGSSTARRLLYESGPFTVDVEVDEEIAGGVRIMGQAMEAGKESAFVKPVEVTLMRGGLAISRSSANEFGEFQFVCDRTPDLRLRLTFGESRAVDLVLPD